MKAYLCSICEKTTYICQEQLERFGFEVVLLGDNENWASKYRKFLDIAHEACIRIDADIIPNEKIRWIIDTRLDKNGMMAQFKTYDFYRNNIGITSPVFYSKKALEIIRKNVDKIDWRRPEATAWRLPEINPHTYTFDWVVGLHGFFQTKEDMERHKQNKIDRFQIKEYDFDLAIKILNL